MHRRTGKQVDRQDKDVYLSVSLSLPACLCPSVSLSFCLCFALCKRTHEGPGFRMSEVLDSGSPSGFWISILWIPDSNLLDSGFHTKVDSGFQTIVDSGFQQQKFAGFRIPDSLTWGDLFVCLCLSVPLSLSVCLSIYLSISGGCSAKWHTHWDCGRTYNCRQFMQFFTGANQTKSKVSDYLPQYGSFAEHCKSCQDP